MFCEFMSLVTRNTTRTVVTALTHSAIWCSHCATVGHCAYRYERWRWHCHSHWQWHRFACSAILFRTRTAWGCWLLEVCWLRENASGLSERCDATQRTAIERVQKSNEVATISSEGQFVSGPTPSIVVTLATTTSFGKIGSQRFPLYCNPTVHVAAGL